MLAQPTGPKGLRPEELTECPSFQGLLDVAEAEEGIALVPDVPEVPEAPAEVTARVAVHVRHPVVAVGIFPEPFLFIERGVPLTFQQLIALLFKDEGSSLCAYVNRLLRGQEGHALLRSGRTRDDLLERANAELVAGLEDAARVRKVLVGDVIVDAVELLAVLLHELVELSRMIVSFGHRHDAEVNEFRELLRGFSRGRQFSRIAKPCFSLFWGEVNKPLPLSPCELPRTVFREGVNLQASQFGRSCVDDNAHRFVLCFQCSVRRCAESVAMVLLRTSIAYLAIHVNRF